MRGRRGEAVQPQKKRSASERPCVVARSSQIRSTVERSTSGGACTARSTPPRLTNFVATAMESLHREAINNCTLGTCTTWDVCARGSVSLNSSTHEPPQQPFEA